MGVIAWIFLGLFSGLLASRLIPGTRAHGLAFNSAIGIAGALLGGWTAALTGRANEPGQPGQGLLVTVPARHPHTPRSCG